MSITTRLDSEDYVRTSKMILAEWLLDAVQNEADIVFSYPHRLEESNAVLNKPLLWLRMLQGTVKNWQGKAINTGDGVLKGEFRRLYGELFIIASNTNEQGSDKVDELAGLIAHHLLDKGYLLGQSGLKKVKINPPADVLEWQNSNFVGVRHAVSYQVLITA